MLERTFKVTQSKEEGSEWILRMRYGMGDSGIWGVRHFQHCLCTGWNILLEYCGNIRRSEGTKLKKKKQKPRDSENWRCFVFPKAKREEKAGSVYSTDEGGSCSFSIYFSIPRCVFPGGNGRSAFLNAQIAKE